MTESRAVSTMTGTRDPWARSWSSTLEAVEAGQADVEDHQVEAAAERLVEALAAVGDDRALVARRRAGPWRRTRRCAPRPRRSGCGPWVLPSDDGQGDDEPGAAAGRRPSTVTVAAVGRGDGPDDRQARGRTPRRRAWTRCGRTARRSCSRSAAGTRARCRAPRAGRCRRRPRTPMATWSPARVCFTALSASWSTAWVTRCSSMVASRVAGGSSSSQSRSPRPRALASSVWVSRSTSTGCGAEEVGPVGLGQQDQVADQPRHPVDLVEQQRAGLARPRRGPRGRAARGGRGARSAASCSSWPASSRNSRWPTKAASSRSSMPLKVRVRAVMSSLPVLGDAAGTGRSR